MMNRCLTGYLLTTVKIKIGDKKMNTLYVEEDTVKSEKSNVTRIMKFLNNVEVNTTISNSMIMLFMLLIMTILILSSKELLHMLEL